MVSVSRDMEEASDLVELAVVVRESIEQTSQLSNVHQRDWAGKERSNASQTGLSGLGQTNRYDHVSVYRAATGWAWFDFPVRNRSEILSIKTGNSGAAWQRYVSHRPILLNLNLISGAARYFSFFAILNGPRSDSSANTNCLDAFGRERALRLVPGATCRGERERPEGTPRTKIP